MSIFAPLLKAFMGGGWSQDQGVDINGGTSAIANQPLLAIESGTIVGHGIGGFGQWAPILKLDHPINGYDYVYYGHAGPNGQVPVGTHVNGGQPVGTVGAGIVGQSTGPHLEIGFSDARGTPIPGSSSTMLALLHGASPVSAQSYVDALAKQRLSGGAIQDAAGAVAGVPGDIANAISGAFNGLLNSIVSHAKYAGLALVAIVGGFMLISQGVKRATHAEAPA